MPMCYIEAPPGISPDAKKRMMEKITAAIDEGYNHATPSSFYTKTNWKT